MNRILIVEDDKWMGPTLNSGLAEHGYSITLATSGGQARTMVESGQPDLVILDLGLPDGDGIDWLRGIRTLRPDLPVLILTARDQLTDRVAGLDAGADDYIVKPFAFAEVLARVRALLRRSTSTGQSLEVNNLRIDLLTRRVTRDGQGIELTPREFDLLVYLARHVNQIVSREMLAEHVWRETSRFTPLDNVIDVHLSRLRKKLRTDTDFTALRVIRGVGISLETSHEA